MHHLEQLHIWFPPDYFLQLRSMLLLLLLLDLRASAQAQPLQTPVLMMHRHYTTSLPE
jgi:hypothetical protein